MFNSPTEFGTERSHTRRTASAMRIRIVAFAALRELFHAPEHAIELPAGARVADAWSALAHEHPALAAHRASTRVARNGQLASFEDGLADGDELALLPPVGGG
jgi:molybdopterin converting factor small subunit